MKFLFSFKSLMVFAVLSILFTSCTDDGTGGGGTNTKNPTVDFVAGLNVITSDATLNIGEEFSVNIVGEKTDNDLKVITIQEAGTKVALDRLSIAANPLTLNATAFDLDITIKAHTDISTKAYSFIVEDVLGNKTTKTINITTNGTPPVVTPDSLMNLNIAPSGLVLISVSVDKGTSPLKTVSVSENNVLIADAGRLFYNQLLSPFSTNPFAIPAADVDGLERDIIVRVAPTSGTYVYTLTFTDETGLSDNVSITVNVGTPLNNLEGILLNQAGQTGTGGCDLDTGASTGSTNATAEIRDEGIDLGLPVPSNWKKQISGVNGSELRYIKKGQNGVPETFSFDAVTTKEEVVSLFGNGVAFTLMNATNTRLVSNVIQVGDVLAVKNGEKYYLIVVTNITTTTDDNEDQYTFDVKL